MKEQIKDLTEAIKDEGFHALMESDMFRSVVTALIKQTAQTEAGALIGALISGAAPRVHGVYLSYRQNRFERNMTRMVAELLRNVEDLKIAYAALSDEIKDLYSSTGIEMLLDNIVDEQQPEKIKWNVNGFVGMMSNDSNENMLKMFFDTLDELTVLDIETLKMYRWEDPTSPMDLAKQFGIDYDQLRMVKEKLVLHGLMVRKNDEQRDVNLDNIVEYLQKNERDANSRNPKGVKLPQAIKKIGRTETYKMTSMGRAFLVSIGEGNFGREMRI